MTKSGYMAGADINEIMESLSERDWQETYLAHSRNERVDLIPFPKDEVQFLTNGQRGEAAANAAISILNTILDCVNSVSTVSKDMRVLDYGCGWGRLTRLLPYYFYPANIVGVDVSDQLIDSANGLLPFLRHVKISSMTPLPFDDESFDMVFANSVFSHLSEASFKYALGELARVLSVAGILVISTLDEKHMNLFYENEKKRRWITKLLGSRESALMNLNESGFIWGYTKTLHEYGIAIIKPIWINTRFHEFGLRYCGVKRRNQKGSQNYHFGIKSKSYRGHDGAGMLDG